MAVGLTASLQAQQPLPGQPASAGTLSGTVRDTKDVTIPGVPVTLLRQDSGADARTVTADTEGAFTFTDVAPGSYRVKVEAAGLEPLTSEAFVFRAGETQQLPLHVRRLPTSVTTVNVNASVEQVAEAQVKQEEQQRIFGVLPNYYTSYIWDAAPMKPKQKFGMARRVLTDPVSILTVGGIAGAEQWHKTFPGYGQGSIGYAKRFGATYADTISSRTFGSAIYPILFHQDPRYFYRGSGSVGSRVFYALENAFICRGDDGKLEPNYSHVLGSFTAAGISNAYKSPQDRQLGLTFRNGLIITVSAAVENLLREFISRPFTPNVPAFANGKP